MNRWVKRLGLVCLIPVVLVLLVSLLLYVPAVQHFALRKATAYAEEATGMSISIDRIRLAFPLDLSVRGVEVLTPERDTLLAVDELGISIQLLPLLKKDVSIDGITLKNGFVNTFDLIDGLQVKGQVGRFFVQAKHILPDEEKVLLNLAELSHSSLELLLTEPKADADTTETDLHWTIELEKALVDEVSFSYRTYEDSSRMESYFSKLLLTGGLFDLGEAHYDITRLSLGDASVSYAQDDKQPEEGFDAAHIVLNQLHFELDSIHYHDKEIYAAIRSFSLKERSGLEVRSLTGAIQSDTAAIVIPELLLKTNYSEARLLGTIPWRSLEDQPTANLRALFSAFIGREDVLLFSGLQRNERFAASFPHREMHVVVGVEGNMQALDLKQLKIALDGAFQVDASGRFRHLTDSLKRSGELQFMAESDSLDFLLDILDEETKQGLRIPPGMTLSGSAALHNRAYTLNALFSESDGRVAWHAQFDQRTTAYEMSLRVDSLEPVHFMPQDSLYWLTADVEAKGSGLDPFSKRTHASIHGALTDIRYGKTSVSNVSLDGTLQEHQFEMKLDSRYPLAEMTLSLSGMLERNKLDAMLVWDMENLDLQGFHLSENPFSMSFQLFSELQSDFKKDHLLDMTLGNWEIATSAQRFQPKTLTLHARSNPDTTRVSFHAGDLGIELTGTSDLESMQHKLLHVQADILEQLTRDSVIHLAELRPCLPEMYLTVQARKDNPVYNLLQYFLDTSFSGLNFSASTSPEDGIRVQGGVYTIVKDSMLLDTVRLSVRQDSVGLFYAGDVIKKKYLNQEAFRGGVYGQIRDRSADAQFYYTDQQGKTGLDLGVQVDKMSDGIRMTFFPEKPTLFFLPFELNDGNYIHILDKKNIDANLKLTGNDNAALWIHSVRGAERMDELHAELSQIDLGIMSKGFSFMPNLKGLLNVDFQYAPMDSSYMLVADANIDNLFYEGGRVGELMFNGVFLPLDFNNSQIDMHLYRDRQEVMNLTTLYTTGKKDRLEGEVHVSELPLEMFTPFIPDKMASLAGVLNGNLAVSGTTEAPQLNGGFQAADASVLVSAAATTLRLEEKEVTIKDNLLAFDKYKIYASGDNPFVINGTVDLNDPARLMTDLTMTANNLQLVNAKRSKESLVYGKLFVNMNSTLKGPMSSLKMRGDMRVLGTTDLTYVMVESPLTVQDRLDGLVTFVSFGDTIFRKQRRPMGGVLPGGGLDMLMTIRIDPAVRMKIDLTPDRSSYVELEGGGDLAFQYTATEDMLLNGRYALTGGTVKYELPIVSAKNFTIKEGSYIEWSGDMMNPRMNLTATERVRTSVTPEGQSARIVNFDVGITVTQTMENMALDFTLSAPEDLAMQTELVGKGTDERRKLAVGLLVTGMYLGSGSTGSGMNMGSALNSFLQSEINTIAGSALKTVDVTFGMDSYNNSGENRTDYSFSFAKRFYNDRIRIVIGGRISSGDNVEESQSDNFIDNVSIEYRLDEGGSRYVKLFHNKNYESLLEGEIIETGVGIVLKRRMVKLSELFDFRKRKVEPVVEEE